MRAYHSPTRAWIALAAILCLNAAAAQAQPAPAESADEAISLHAQSTVIEQWHGAFPAPYTGPNSLKPVREDKHTITATGFLGARVWDGGAVFYDPEFSQGTGLSGTVGMAGFPNGEATRAGGNRFEYATARLFLRQTFGLGGDREEVKAGQNELAGHRDVDRITVTLGKLSAVDQFDDNAYSHDPRTQFLNWALMDNAAWDYPADAKGYTAGGTIEWNTNAAALRYGWFMEPAEANGRSLDKHVRSAHAQVLEWEQRYTVDGHKGAVRPLVFWNRAGMGSYDEAVRSVPVDVRLSRRYRSKAGAGVSWDQELADGVGVFGRAGWNDGRNESWAFTEVDRTVSAGVSLNGKGWGRDDDTLALAALGNGLSGPHRRYLEAGGQGFIVGDGRLRYGPEQTLETYYNWKPVGWLALALDYEYARHPGYNRDRGPVSIYGVRGHVEF